MNDAPEDLAPLLEELAWTLEELRDELEPRRPGPVRALFRFTERFTIPAVVAVLEANVRLLELTADAIRLADERGADGARGRDRATGPDARDPASGSPDPRLLDALDAALDDLGDALRGVPTDPDARRLLEEARALRREVRTRVDAESTGAISGSRDGRRSRRGERHRAGRRSRTGRTRYRDRSNAPRSRTRASVSIPVEEESADRSGADANRGENTRGGTVESADGEPGGVAIDVDAELESIRRDLDAGDRERRDADERGGDGVEVRGPGVDEDGDVDRREGDREARDSEDRDADGRDDG